MDNYEAVAYACVALAELQKEGKDVNTNALKGKMLLLMDLNSAVEIYKKYVNLE